MMPNELRELSALVGFLAFAIIAYRLVSTWDDDATDYLVKALGLGVLALLLVGSIGSVVYARANLPGIIWVQSLALFARTMGLLVGILWPRLQGRRSLRGHRRALR